MNLNEYYDRKDQIYKEYTEKLKKLEIERFKIPLKILENGVEYYCVDEIF